MLLEVQAPGLQALGPYVTANACGTFHPSFLLARVCHRFNIRCTDRFLFFALACIGVVPCMTHLPAERRRREHLPEPATALQDRAKGGGPRGPT